MSMPYAPSPKDLLMSALMDAFDELGEGMYGFAVEEWRLDAEPDALLFLDGGRTFRVGLEGSVEQTDGRIASTNRLTRELQNEVQAALARRRQG